MKVVIDTSIFIEFSRTKKGPLAELLHLQAEGKVDLVIPSVVVFEFWSGQSMKIAKNIKQAENLFAQGDILDLDEKVAKVAGKLRREGYVEGIDALIAAIAIEQDAYLVTLNRKHFLSVPGLRVWEGEKQI